MSRLFSSLGGLLALLGFIIFLIFLFSFNQHYTDYSFYGLILFFLGLLLIFLGQNLRSESEKKEDLEWEKRREEIDTSGPKFNVWGQQLDDGYREESYWERKLYEYDEKEFDDLVHQAKVKGVYDDIMEEISEHVEEIEEKEGRHLETKEVIEIFEQLLKST